MSPSNSPKVGGRYAQPRHVSPLERDRRLGAQTAKEIVKRTRRLIARHGIAAASTIEIARAAELTSNSAPLWYFGSRGRLMVEVMRAEQADDLKLLEKKLKRAKSRRELVAGAQQFLSELVTDSGRVQLQGALFDAYRASVELEDVAGALGVLRRERRDTLARLLADKQRQGVVVLACHESSIAALVQCLAQGLLTELVADHGFKPQEAIQDAGRMLDALLLEPGTKPEPAGEAAG